MHEPSDSSLGVVIVDHGSKRAQSNALLLEVVELFKQQSGLPIVEPAHMELAEPSIDAAFAKAVAAGAREVVVLPYFFAKGRHWSEDIPRLAAQAAAKHAGVNHRVADPLGLHDGIITVLQQRLAESISAGSAK